jgi:choline kinase
MTKILIATPAFGGAVYAQYTESLLNTCFMLIANKIQFQVKFISNQLVTRARNMLSSLFLEDPTYTHMMFIDADIVWTATDVKKLIDHDKECVIGIYPNKQYYWDKGNLILLPSSVIEKEENSSTNASPLVEVKYAATGFMLLRRSCLEKIKHEVETFTLPSEKGKATLHNYFDCNVVENDYLTEDYYFSHLFRKNGGKIFADKTICLHHIGPHQYGTLIV